MKKSLVSLISWLLVIAMMASVMPLAAFADETLPMKATVNPDEGKITVSGDVVTVKAGAFTAKEDGTGFVYTIGISGAGAAAEVGTWITEHGDKIVVEVTSQKIRDAVGDVIATKTFDFNGDDTVDQTITVKIDSTDKKLGEMSHAHEGTEDYMVVQAAVANTDTTDGLTAGKYCKICGFEEAQTVVKANGTLKTGTAVSGTLKNDATVVKQFSTGEFLCTLTKGCAVKVLKQWTYDSKVWGQIEVSGVGTGFINMADFTTSSESTSGSTAKKTGVIVNADSVNVRDYPNAGSTKVGTVKRGDEVTIYEQVTKGTKDWAKISAKEDKWVCMDYIQVTSGSGSTDSTGSGDTATDEKAIATGVVSSSINLNVRSAPGTTKPLVKSLPTGTQVSIFEVKSVNGADWGRIGKDQWVCMSYVQLQTGSIESGGSSTSGTANATIVNCSTGVNVRSSASVSGALAGRIAVNTRVYISEVKTASNGSKWGKTDKGWVCMDYVKLDSTSEVGDSGSVESTVSTTTGAPYANVTVPAKVNAGGAKVYLNADTNSKLLVVLGAGQSIKISGRALVKDVQWGKVTIGGYTGWLKMSDVSLEEVKGSVATAQLSAYEEASLSAKVNVIWGKGQAVTITDQKTDGTYLWGKTSSGWVNMASVSIISSDTGSGTGAATISISASVTGNTLDMKDDDGNTIISLVKGTKITITDLKEDTGKCLGKVTVDSFSGWVDLSGVTQESIQGTVASDGAVLYTKHEDTAAAKSTKTVKKGTSVTILERVKAGGTVWGKLIVDKVYLWIKMDQITTAAVPTTPTNPSDSTGTGTGTGSVTTPTTGAAGTVVNTDSLNVRSAAGARNALVTTLKRGTAVTVFEQTTVDGALWGRIDQGWVAMSYVDLSSKSTGTTSGVTGGIATGGTTIMTTVPSGAVAVGYVNYVNEVNIRSGAGQGYAKAGTLKKGANVVIYEQKLVDGMIWGRIDQGWICTSYVTMTGASVTGAGTAGTIARCFFTANVRSSPGVGNALVGKIMVNSRVEILETKVYSGEQWGRTSIGWINMNYVLLDGASAI